MLVNRNNVWANRLKSTLIQLTLIACCIIIAFHFLWMVSNSIKTKDEIWAMLPQLLPVEPQWVNYTDALRGGVFFRYL